jgi:cysteine sulfinate desulfinase/cysteine desulfurase-like protein
MSIYMDYNATTPLDESVVEVIGTTSRDFWANPSSSYERGRRAKDVVLRARNQESMLYDFFCP